jgi:hypothetical protein
LDACYQCSSENKCLKCATNGFYLDVTSSRCAPCPSGCKTCDGNGKCLECLSGNTWDAKSGVCYKCQNDNRCLSCDFNTNTCLACAPGYYQDPVSKSSCFPCSPGCLSCSSLTQCDPMACRPTHWYEEEKKSCVSCGPQCTSCNG